MTAGVDESPAETAKTTPLMTTGVSGATKSRETHPRSRLTPAASGLTNLHAITVPTGPWAAPSNQRVPSGACHVAKAPGSKFPSLEELAEMANAFAPSQT